MTTAPSRQVCEQCGATRGRARSRAALSSSAAVCWRSCIRLSDPPEHFDSDLPRAGARCAGADASGVWRYPRAGAAVGERGRDRHAPGRQHAAALAARRGRVGRRRAFAHQARRPQSDRLVQGPRHDRRHDAGQAHGSARRRLRVDGQHVGVARRVRGAGRDSGVRVRAGGQRGAGQAGADAGLRRHARCSCAATSINA